MTKRFNVKRCAQCGGTEFEDRCIEYNDKFFCGIRCKIAQERTEDETLDQKVHAFPTRISTRNNDDWPDG